MALLSPFTVGDLEDFSRVLRTIGKGARDMEEVAQRVCDHLFEHLRTEADEPACLTVTLHKTHTFKQLPPRLQRLAREADGSVVDDTACLTRMGYAGYDNPEPEPGSFVRPLTPAAFDEQPILVGMLVAMGLDVETAIDPGRAATLGLHHRDLNMFLVPDLGSSEWLAEPDTREQVTALQLASMLGIGGGLPSGDLFFLFLFSHVPIDERSADLLRSLVPAVKASLIPQTLQPFGDAAL